MRLALGLPEVDPGVMVVVEEEDPVMVAGAVIKIGRRFWNGEMGVLIPLG
jgi:hypothetical protein